MFVDPVMGFALLAAMMAVAGLDMMMSARTPSEKAHACAFMAILVTFVATLVTMIVI